MNRTALLPLFAASGLLLAGCSSAKESPQYEGAPTERGAAKQAAASPPAPARLGTAQKSTTPEADISATVHAYKVLRSEVRPDRKGYTYAGADIRTCLTRATERISLSWDPWSLRYADDTVIEPVSSWSDEWFSVPLYPAVGREVRVGRCIRGWAVFEVPTGKQPTSVVYAPSAVSSAPVPLEWSAG